MAVREIIAYSSQTLFYKHTKKGDECDYIRARCALAGQAVPCEVGGGNTARLLTDRTWRSLQGRFSLCSSQQPCDGWVSYHIESDL